MNDFQIIKTHPRLISFVDSLQKKNAESLSFYPKCVFEREAERGRIFLGLLNGEPCGYLYVGAICDDIKCHQVCIEYDARRRLYGACLVQAMEDYALEGNAYTITLRCGFDLQANEFWRSLGYGCLRIEDGGIRRMRKINVWQKTIMKGLFTDEYIEPAKGKTSSSIWRKHKKTTIITQFARGKKLKDYRAMVISASEANGEAD